jgi:hypothetical protein
VYAKRQRKRLSNAGLYKPVPRLDPGDIHDFVLGLPKTARGLKVVAVFENGALNPVQEFDRCYRSRRILLS